MHDSRHSVTNCLAFCSGAIAALHGGYFPVQSHVFAASLTALALVAIRFPAVRAPLVFMAGLGWASVSLTTNLSSQLDPILAGTEIQLEGKIASIPAFDNGNAEFLFEPVNPRAGLPPLFRMRWYRDAPNLRANDYWQLNARVLPPRGRLNFTGFDFEKWLFARSIGGLGTVRHGELLTPANPQRDFILELRQGISERIDRLLAGHQSIGLVKALAVGDRSGIASAQWQFLAASGTTHLVAISGMHIGMIALFGFLAGKFLFRLAPATLARMGSQRLGIILAMLFAGFYALLSGFVVPAQRALLILLVILSGQFMRYRAGTMYSLLLAMTGVILLDPLAPLRTGFWLSFSAVFLLLFAAAGKKLPQNKLRKMLRAQWVVIIGMTPLTLYWFQQVSVISIPANLVAIPLVSFLVVPLILLAVVLLYILPSVAGFALWGSAQLLGGLQYALITITGIPGILRQVSEPGIIWILIALLGVLLLLAPRANTGRYAGIVMVLPILLGSPATPGDDTLEMTVLDVGQGSAVLLRTQRHLLLYDTGPGDGFERQVVDSTIMPAIQNSGFDGPTNIIVSHADLDHSGGMRRLAEHFPNRQWYSSLPPARQFHLGDDCRTPLAWNRDGFVFEVLHPGPGLPYLGNDSSCVLQVIGDGTSLLIPGDISEAVEQRLVSTGRLKAGSVLVVPHHGSASSSSKAFIDSISPRLAVISSGYLNRFNLPKDTVVDRYQSNGTPVMSTAECGAIRVTIAQNGKLKVQSARKNRAAIWRQKAGSSCQ